MIKRLLSIGSILKLAMRSCVLEKDTSTNLPMGQNSLPVVVALPYKRFANRIKKSCSVLVWFDKRRVPASLIERTNQNQLPRWTVFGMVMSRSYVEGVVPHWSNLDSEAEPP